MKKAVYILASVALINAAACNDKDEGYQTGKVEIQKERITGVEIDWEIGEIDVEQSPNDTLYAGEENADNIRYKFDDGVLKIERSSTAKKRNAQTAALRVEIPQGLAVEIDGKNAEITLGILSVKTLLVDTDAGNICAEKISCQRAEFDTESGGIYIGDIEGEYIDAESDSGEIKIGVSKPSRLEISAKDNDIYLFLLSDLGARVHLQTTGGVLKSERPFEKKDGYYDYAGTEICRVNAKTRKGNLYIE
ncbi:MAG: DUF4097 family beta strand repeat protein [Clostridia bacterium]|nr:DUF4097 family beta strand repeat protein [Clostridia bacterium]